MPQQPVSFDQVGPKDVGRVVEHVRQRCAKATTALRRPAASSYLQPYSGPSPSPAGCQFPVPDKLNENSVEPEATRISCFPAIIAVAGAAEIDAPV